MKKFYFLVLMTMTGVGGVLAQTTVFIDDFNRASVSPGGVPSMTYTNTLVGTSTAAITSNALRIANGTTGGISYVTGSTSTFSSPYNTSLSSNATLVTWTFNFRYERTTNPAGILSGSYGTAIVLAGSSSTLTTGTGYAIVYGNGGTPDPIRLVAYSSGVSTSTDIIMSGIADLSAFTNYVSVRVTYNPSTHGWSLYLRDDGTTAWADPATGVNTQIGSTTVNSTYTSTALTAFGFIWSHASTVAATNASSFDNYKVTLAAVSPGINVTPASLTGFTALSGVNSAEQTYNVDGANLTADIVITPPVGFGISTTLGGPYTVNPATVSLTPTAGTVASTPIYVAMNSTTPGANSGNIAHTSTGAVTKNVAVSGNVIAPEPTVQSSITIGAVTNSTIVVNFAGGNGARRILLAKQATAVDSDPIDAVTYTAIANFGSGSLIGSGNYVVYDGIGNTQLVTGLTAGATYHFAIYEYNDGGLAGAENYLVPGGIGNATATSTAVPYVWTGVVSTDWQNALNWAPARLFPATNDSLLFINLPVNDTITNVPTQSVGYMGVSMGSKPVLVAASAGRVLSVGNLTGTDFFVEAGSEMVISSSNGLTINMITGANARIDGTFRMNSGAHRFTAADASGIVFTNGSLFRAGTGLSGNPFGNATANSVLFNSGSVMEQFAGSNPFALGQPASVVVFQSGSLFRALANFAPSFSGRTYANVEINATGFSQSGSGGGLLSIDSLLVSQGVLNLNLTGGIHIKGNITVAAGQTLTFTPASANTVTFNGTAAQSIINNGTFGIGALTSLTLNNAAGVTLNTNVTMGATTTLTLTAGVLRLTPSATLLTLSNGTLVTGASNASYVDGKVKKIGNTTFTFPVGKTGFGYVPIGLSNYTGGTTSDEFTAEYIRGNARQLGPVTAFGIDHVSGCDYWTLDKGIGTPTDVDVTGYWSPNNVCNGTYIDVVAEVEMAHFNGVSWDLGSSGFSSRNGNATTGDITWTDVASFSPFSLASSSGNNPLPIKINYFTGVKQGANHLLDWKVTCLSTPNVTMVLERKADGGIYNAVTSIFADAVRCNEPFNFTDAAPLPGINYYRLKLTDVDGGVSYSSTVALLNAVKGFDIVGIAPNPVVTGKFNLNVTSAKAGKLDINIIDMMGRTVSKQSVSMIAGFSSLPVNVAALAPGTYTLYGTVADERSAVIRFVKQ